MELIDHLLYPVLTGSCFNGEKLEVNFVKALAPRQRLNGMAQVGTPDMIQVHFPDIDL
jgi:hypothetical protein